MRNPLVEANKALFGQVNKVRDWHKLPRPLALLNLRAFRDELRELNLYDTEPSPEGNGAPPAEALEELPKHRTYDGSRYDPAHPRMGMAGARFGRNHPLGIMLAAVLFGALYQGGSELSFDMPTLTRDMVVVIQGLIILVCGALEHALRGPVEALLRS